MITNRLNTLRQSSARHWRIGQEKDCRTVYLYYAGTSQEIGIKHMSAKLAAALYLEGDLLSGGFAAEDTGSMEAAILKSLESQ